MINVRIAAGFSQKDSCLSSVLQSAPSSLFCTAMADRNSPEEASRRLAAERERLQAIARRNEEKAKERMRLKQEAVAAAEQAKGAAERAAKAAGVAFPKGEDICIKAPTRPPPGVSPGKRGGTSPAAASRRPTPPPKRAISPRPPSYLPPSASGSAWGTPPPARSPSEEHVSVFGDFADVAAAKAKGNGDTKPAKPGESSQRRGPPKVAFVAEAIIIPILGETDQEYKCRVVRERYTMVNGETPEEEEMVNFYKQVIAALSRGIISSMVMHVMISRHWGKDHKDTGTSLMTVTKTYKQLHAWMRLDHFSVCCGRSTDRHDLIHNGLLAWTQAAATLKTKLKSGELVVGITGKLPFSKETEGVLPSTHSRLLRISVELRRASGFNIRDTCQKAGARLA